MIKFFTFFLSLIISYFFILTAPVFAEVVNFREAVDKQQCLAMTLNETVAAKVNGQTGSACDFSVDVAAAGEWVSTGAYFDSPPYAWGTNAYYAVEKSKNSYSFTCSQPVYELDKTGLPSFISLTKEEDIPASSSGTLGKRYFFSVSEQAQAGSSFNMPLKYTTSCDMRMKTPLGIESTMVPIKRESGVNCDQLQPITINPRVKTSAFPVMIGSSCEASPSPSPSLSPSPSPTPPPACNVNCSSDEYCQTALDGCTACIPNSAGGGTCQPPPACNTLCINDKQCVGAKDGCTACVPNNTGSGSVCKPPPACNTTCTSDRQCAGAKDGCTACINGFCKVPPSCGTSCTTKAGCSGSKDGCSECLEGTCTDYSANMCKCDGMVADMIYPSDSFNFEAFGKVEGSDVKKAQIADVTFRLTKDNQVIAKSSPITPTIVESSANKLRVKASWSTPPPQVTKGATYRVFADVRCKPKRITASNENFSPNPKSALKLPDLKPPPGLKMLVDVANKLAGDGNVGVKQITSKLMSMFGNSTVQAQTSNLQLRTLNFVKVLDTDNCRFVMFKFDETLF